MRTEFSEGAQAPTSARTLCPRCHAGETVLGTETERYVYLRCGVCFEVWAIPERRQIPRTRPGNPSVSENTRAQSRQG
jgi:ribosomal protein S27AE